MRLRRGSCSGAATSRISRLPIATHNLRAPKNDKTHMQLLELGA